MNGSALSGSAASAPSTAPAAAAEAMAPMTAAVSPRSCTAQRAAMNWPKKLKVAASRATGRT
ncbi:hypothetical protein [Nonomuraea turcica]|uniref:hypothetical protein n=1 Tax=Nonomuraea sp. G32 TaxID=3067274 RepID=UPI00273BCF3F|nr:hypothetical protein [Nonomuraea sp. G32]MDP4507304.1 hypothetical protein [Nonomuraea sp. G32]